MPVIKREGYDVRPAMPEKLTYTSTIEWYPYQYYDAGNSWEQLRPRNVVQIPNGDNTDYETTRNVFITSTFSTASYFAYSPPDYAGQFSRPVALVIQFVKNLPSIHPDIPHLPGSIPIAVTRTYPPDYNPGFPLPIPFQGLKGHINEYLDKYETYGSRPERRTPYKYVAKDENKPCYYHLLKGFELDIRTIPGLPTITLNNDLKCKLSYYKVNNYEPIYGLRSIDWVSYDLDIKSGVAFQLPITDCVLGTLYSDIQIINILRTKAGEATNYRWSDLLPESIAALFAEWNTLYNSDNFIPSGYTLVQPTRKLLKLCANNDIWNNNPNIQNDINFDITHELFSVNHQRAYDWHISPQTNNSLGILTMDSPRIIEIHAALEADNYSTNRIDSTKKRVNNLGHLIEKISFLLGYRPEDDGTFDKVKEKDRLRKIISDKDSIDTKKIGVNNFGTDGMILRRLSNRFDKDKIVSDECVIVQDVIQLISEYQDQLNLAIGIQESTAIEIKQDDITSRYPNQLALLIELVNIAASNHNMIRASLISSIVTQGQTSEIIGGLGLPSITKTMPIDIDGKTRELPYKGIAPHRSISQEVATCTANIGIVLGQII